MTIKYPLSANGITTFQNDVYNDAMESLQEKGEISITIIVNNREITLPLLAETYEALTELLKTMEELEQC